MQAIDRNTCRNIAYALLFCYFCMNAALIWWEIPAGNKEAIGRSAATLENLLLIMAGFFYGSSLGSRAKDSQGINPDSGHTKPAEPTTERNSNGSSLVP
jgi:hypothetical protein